MGVYGVSESLNQDLLLMNVRVAVMRARDNGMCDVIMSMMSSIRGVVLINMISSCQWMSSSVVRVFMK